MKSLFKLITVSAFGVILVVGAYAQAAGPNGGGVQNGGGLQGGKQGGKLGARRGYGKIEQEILAKVNPPLSADQKAKIEQLNAKTKDSLVALKEKAKTGDRAALRTEIQKIQEERRNGMKSILTPAQQKSYADLMKDAILKLRKDGGKGGGAGKGGSGKG